MYHLTDYDYHLPETLIAQQPARLRDQSRLLCLSRANGRLSHNRFKDLPSCLKAGDVLVLNNTRVAPARLYGRKPSGGRVEILILDYASGIGSGLFECLVKASKRPKIGGLLFFGNGVAATVAAVKERTCTLDFSACGDLRGLFDTIGHMPLPPYIRRQDTREDQSRYQTVYAQCTGAVAAPTAGLHFTADLLDALAGKGVELVYLTLHVGHGTFVPVRVNDIRGHRMHNESFEVSGQAARRINLAKARGGRIVAVGTTSVRTLEFCTDEKGEIRPGRGACDLFIYPGYTFKMVDAMITNFHLPKSTLLMLVSAFAGREMILNTYAEAIRQQYRFYSYGDAMLII